MLRDYLLHPEAEASLRSGFGERVDAYAVRVRDLGANLPYRHGPIDEDDLEADVGALKGEGFYGPLAESHPRIFGRLRTSMNEILNERAEDRSSAWRVRREGGRSAREPAELADILLFTGIIARQILDDPTDFWQAGARHWFRRATDFIASLGVYVQSRVQELSSTPRESPLQTFEHSHGGRRWRTVVTGSGDFDLRVLRTDTTPYHTLSPLGHLSSFRPVTEPDRQILSPHHSMEPDFLAILLRWWEQIGRREQWAEGIDRSLSLAESIVSSRPTAGYIDFATGSSERMVVVGRRHDIPRVGGGQEHAPHTLSCVGDWQYRTWLDTDDSLVFDFARESGPIGKPCMRFYPEEAGFLIRALFAHAQACTGRVSLRNLVDVLECYRRDSKPKSE